MIFEIRKVSFLFRSSLVRATPSSISSCVLFHFTLYFASMLLYLGWSTKQLRVYDVVVSVFMFFTMSDCLEVV
ncbi:hypothetical protein H5410_021982 [Solanum commersonii]|uniref:Uncharacterized protein n=1 Tax=Solanum commersonii TaxID=4109 RepID=A0A9J5ZE34_SOLCO|nr:hypothetical protein H5410_021982 [Solanum commersonii]